MIKIKLIDLETFADNMRVCAYYTDGKRDVFVAIAENIQSYIRFCATVEANTLMQISIMKSLYIDFIWTEFEIQKCGEISPQK